MIDDKTCMSYWFPLIEAAGLPVPRTKILKMPAEAQQVVVDVVLDGKKASGGWIGDFIRQIDKAAIEFGYPVFLRTGHTSAKHDWDHSCYLRDSGTIGAHAARIVEYSECVGIIGLPWEIWAVREFLPTIPLGVCHVYNDMPICREFRFFVKDDEVICNHPYWPRKALEDGGAHLNDYDYESLCTMKNIEELSDLARRAGKAVGGYWSVDLLETERGWFITDMAEGEKSFHWEGCPHTTRRER